MHRISSDSEFLDSGKIVIDADGIPIEPVSKQSFEDALEPKASKSYVDSTIEPKADKSYVDSSLEPKADKSYVDSIAPVKSFMGTGFPEGKVTAPVGSIYTDSAATNGAIRWTKTSGTGSSGWVVEYGDTGWRDVTALIPRAVMEGQMLIRRTTTMASIYFYNLLLEDSGLSYQDFGNFLSAGFYDPGIQYFYVGGLANRGANYAAGAVRISRFGGLRIQDVGPGQYMTGMVSLTTGKAWPSTLPGTPA